MRRAAKALVASRVETFETLHPLPISKQRLERSLAQLGAPRSLRLTGCWKAVEGREVYEATFRPAPGTKRFLHAFSLGLVLLIGASAWAIHSAEEGRALKFLLPMFTLLAVIAIPFVVYGFASHREAEEARIVRAIRGALQDESTAFPPAQRWDDED
jgi:hypothetical protein